MLYPKFKISKISLDECKKACDYVEQRWGYQATKDLMEYLEAFIQDYFDGDASLKDFDPNDPNSFLPSDIDVAFKNLLSKNPRIKRISRNQLFSIILNEYGIEVNSTKDQILVNSIKQTDLIDNYLDEIESQEYIKVNNRYYIVDHDYKVALN